MSEEELRHETEHIGLYFDRLGIPPLAGRVVAYLMISHPPHRTFDEIVDHLQASKSSVSNALKMLEQFELISYRTFPGDRRRHFRVAPEKWISLIRVTDKIRTMIEMFKHVLEVRDEQDEELNPSIRETLSMYRYFEVEIPRLLSRWEEDKKKR
ncbi:MAG: GbsR/MarR family transcriptional regulator [Cyclobacteriaceae bacterium]